MKKDTAIIIFILLFLGFACTQEKIVEVDKPSTLVKLDSLQKLVYKYQADLADSNRINWIDSTKWTFKDSTVFKDSLRIRDSLIIRDSLNIIDSIAFSQGESSLIPDTVIDNHHYKDNIPMRLVDNDLNTRWLDSTYHQIAVFDFGKIVYIDSIFIMTYADLNTEIKVYNIENQQLDTLSVGSVFKPDIEDKTILVWNGFKIDFKGRLFYLETIKGENSWSDLREVKFKGRELK